MTKSTNLFPLFGKQRQQRKEIALQYDRLYRIAWAWTHNQHTAEDLVQDTLTKALEKLDTLKNSARLEVWLTRILSNRFRDQLKTAKPYSELTDEIVGDQPDPMHSVDKAQLISRTRAAINTLNFEHRQVITLIDLAEFSYAETAEILDTPIGTIMSRLARARAKLRQQLESKEHGGKGHLIALRTTK